MSFCVCSVSASDAGLMTAPGFSQEDFPQTRAAGRGWVPPSWGEVALLQLGERPQRIPATHRHCLHAQSCARQATHTNTHAHTLKVVTWRELSNHRMPPHLRANLGPEQTKKTKRSLIRTILLALLPWNGI